jgi:hypothetical protein
LAVPLNAHVVSVKLSDDRQASLVKPASSDVSGSELADWMYLGRRREGKRDTKEGRKARRLSRKEQKRDNGERKEEGDRKEEVNKGRKQGRGKRNVQEFFDVLILVDGIE